MVLEQWFANSQGLVYAAALIPFFILYLIRPKPQHQTIPSLMFLLRDKDKARYNAFLRTLLRELLFFLQFLMIVGLVAAIAQPYIAVPEKSLLAKTILVLDDSASMYTRDAQGVRWQYAIERAKQEVGKENTLILAGKVPRVVLTEESASTTQEYLDRWRPSHQPTILSPSILAAQDFGGADSRVVIISDFSDTDGDQDFMDAVQSLRAKGLTVDLIQVGDTSRQAQNIGIVDVDAGESQTTITIQNFYQTGKSVDVCAEDVCKTLPLKAGGSDTFSFSTIPGLATVKIVTDDDFPIDDSAVVSSPTKTHLDVLVVTNAEFTESYLYHALKAIEQTTPLTFTIEVNNPPTLVDVHHDVIIFYAVDPKLVVSRTVRDAAARVREGGSAILLYQEGMFGMGYDELLPLLYKGEGKASPVINTQTSREYAGMEFGYTPMYHSSSPQKSMSIIAQAEDESPLIATYSVGAGNVLYFGLPEKDASFSSDPLYPVFWRQAINTITKRSSAETSNMKTGTIISAQQVHTPRDTIETGKVLLDWQGPYETPTGVIAASLSNALESNTKITPLEERGSAKSLIRGDNSSKKDVTFHVLVGVLVLALLELLYLKWRGDI